MRILFVTDSPIARHRSGPAIRCLELARVLSSTHEVTIASTAVVEEVIEGVRMLSSVGREGDALRRAVRECDIIITQGLVLTSIPVLARSGKFIVCDFYDPYVLEYLAHPHPDAPDWGYMRQWHTVNEQLLAADVFLCANERQRDFVLGWLGALGRTGVNEYQKDPSFEHLVKVVPFGLSPQPPVAQQGSLRGLLPGVGAEDVVAIWGGGIWDWLDPQTVIRGAAALANERLKLVFVGSGDPNKINRPMDAGRECRTLAEELHVLDRSVFFLDRWIAFDERSAYLCDADIGVSAHAKTIEARYAFRTRVLDYIWASLPMVVSKGDFFSEWIERHEVGLTVRPGDPAAWTSAFRHVFENRDAVAAMRRRLAALAPEWYWQRVAQPLVKFCDAPYHTERPSRTRQRLLPLLNSAYERWRRVAARLWPKT
jgi:glycosyltransferase involved in cell wall biosynthesis